MTAGTEHMKPRQSMRQILDVVATLGVVVASGIVIGKYILEASPRADVSTAGIEIALVDVDLGAAAVGAANAPVGIVMFSDFECPYCKRFALDTLPVIKKELVHAGAVRLSFRHFPLESIHHNARQAAAVAACGAEHGRFWETHDLLFGRGGLERSIAAAVARLGEQVPDGIDSCVSGDGRRIVDRDIVAGRGLGVTGTPSFLVGPVVDGKVRAIRRLDGVYGPDTFRALVQQVTDRNVADR